ncbi:MAG: zf-TFIIB domain-containing protein [Acidobacteria bacterium]|nr:zf-TFIIB domain-containing protein [Acidobacteriota bacterium]
METSKTCPRCQGPLVPFEVEEVGARFTALRCEACGGTFFQAGDLERIDDIIEPHLLEIRHIPSPAEQRRPLLCPVCPGAPQMEKVEHRRDAKVVMDVCPSCHGTWLDRGELEAIHREGLLTFLVNTVRWMATLRRS